MSRQIAVYHQEWTRTVQAALPHLSKPQATVLALFSLGMVCARSRALSAVAAFLAVAVDQQANTLRQRLRESCWEAHAKAGRKRRAIVVESCFVPLLWWVVSRWPGTQLALALNATTLGDRFVVLAISVVDRGCAIPVAWTILTAGEKRAWRREWLRMLRVLHPAIPPSWTVLVLADRGLSARWLFRRIVRLGWHPFLRINSGGTFGPTAHARFMPLPTFAPRPGTSWCGEGTAFKTPPVHLACTLLARWEEGHQDPWLILTDLAPLSCDVCWYGLRIWIERGFKLTKRGGWQWQATRMTNPERAARLWLVVAVATLWLVSVGGEAEATAPESAIAPLDTVLPVQTRQRRATRLRAVAVFHHGLIRLVLAMIEHAPLPVGHFIPEPRPIGTPLPVAILPNEITP
ncbi:MAG: transposase [Chloroflexota bacterium]